MIGSAETDPTADPLVVGQSDFSPPTRPFGAQSRIRGGALLARQNAGARLGKTGDQAVS